MSTPMKLIVCSLVVAPTILEAEPEVHWELAGLCSQ